MSTQVHTHTPGPWKAEIAPNGFSDGGFTAFVVGNYEETGRYGDNLARVTVKFAEGGREITRDEWVANAKLMAAAPSLLDALERIEEHLTTLLIRSENTTIREHARNVIIGERDAARAAIAAARGEA